MNSELAERRAAVLRKRLAEAGLGADRATAASVTRRADRSSAPLSPAQRRMWVLDWFDPSGVAYNVCLHVTFAGSLDVAALGAALRAMVVRHEVLRTHYPLAADQLPRQRIDPVAEVAEFPVPLIDLRDRPPGTAEDLVTELARHRFDLARDWPLRAVLYRTDVREYRLGLVVHHIAWDGGTWPVISAELTRAYASALDGGTVQEELLDAQYGDFAAALADRPVLAADREYWLSRLTDLPGPLALPSDNPGNPDNPENRGGGRRSVVFGTERTGRFTALAAREGVTPFTVLLAAFGALLHRYGSGTDLPIGSATMNRDNAQAQALIGNFGNTLVLRLDASGDPSFTELVRRADTVCAGGFAHQDMPYDEVVAALRESGGARESDPFNVMVLFLTQGLAGPRLPGVRTSWRNVHNGTTQFDLSLEAFLIDGELEIEASYSTEMFSAARVDALLEDLRALLDVVAARPETPLSALAVRDWQVSVPDTAPAELAEVGDREVELRIRRLMAELLEYDAVSAGQDFFALGGNSLLATKLVAQVRSSLGADISVRTVAEHPTPAALAAVVSGLGRDADWRDVSPAGDAPVGAASRP
ncbi:MAG: hypothetical protein QOF99_4760, partial [Pseudonocardiales bacterium]|nr:hypothetical protein [Pseudonocardiales bacterium]